MLPGAAWFCFPFTFPVGWNSFLGPCIAEVDRYLPAAWLSRWIDQFVYTYNPQRDSLSIPLAHWHPHHGLQQQQNWFERHTSLYVPALRFHLCVWAGWMDRWVGNDQNLTPVYIVRETARRVLRMYNNDFHCTCLLNLCGIEQTVSLVLL